MIALKQVFNIKQLYDYISRYKLIYFSEDQNGTGGLYLKAKAERFKLRIYEDLPPVIACRISTGECTESGIVIHGSMFVFSFDDDGWAVQGVLTSIQSGRKVWMTLYR